MYPAEVMSSDAGPRALKCAIIGPCRDQFRLDHLWRVVTGSYVTCRSSPTTCEVMNIVCPLSDGVIDSVLIAMVTVLEQRWVDYKLLHVNTRRSM